MGYFEDLLNSGKPLTDGERIDLLEWKATLLEDYRAYGMTASDQRVIDRIDSRVSASTATGKE